MRHLGKQGYGVQFTRNTLDCKLFQSAINASGLNDKTLSVGAWVKCSTANSALVELNTTGGSGAGASPYHSGSGEWEWLEFSNTVTGTTDINIDCLIRNNNVSATFDNPVFYIGSTIPDYMKERQPDNNFIDSIFSNGFAATPADIIIKAHPTMAGSVELISQTEGT